eukprot:Rmarinus@m.16896
MRFFWGLVVVLHVVVSCTVLPGYKDVLPTYDVEMNVQLRRGETGTVVIRAHADWAPIAASRFRELVESGYYDGTRFYRALKGILVQWGINGDPEVTSKWRKKPIRDEGPYLYNVRSTVSFYQPGKRSRSTEVFINLRNNTHFDSLNYVPFAEVIEGMDVVERMYFEYGDSIPAGKGPKMSLARQEGNKYLKRYFPNLSYIVFARIRDPYNFEKDEL